MSVQNEPRGFSYYRHQIRYTAHRNNRVVFQTRRIAAAYFGLHGIGINSDIFSVATQ